MPFEDRIRLTPNEMYYSLIGMIQNSGDRFTSVQRFLGDDEAPEYGRVFWDKANHRHLILHYPGNASHQRLFYPPTLQHVQEQVAADTTATALLFYPVACRSFEEKHYVSAWIDKQKLIIKDPHNGYGYQNLHELADSLAPNVQRLLIPLNWDNPYSNDWLSGYYVLASFLDKLYQAQDSELQNTKPTVNESFIKLMKQYYKSAIKSPRDPVISEDNPKNELLRKIKQQMDYYSKQKNPLLKHRDKRVKQLEHLLRVIKSQEYQSVSEAIVAWKASPVDLRHEKNNVTLMNSHYLLFRSAHRPSETRMASFIRGLERDFGDVQLNEQRHAQQLV